MSFSSNNFSKAQIGFTLLELMVVIAIISILAAIALPIYQNYSVRAQVTELVLAAYSCRTSVTESIQQASNTDVSAELINTCTFITTKYVKSATVDANGVITVSADEANLPILSVATNTLTLVPIQAGTTELVGTSDGGKTIAGWRCGSATDGTTIPTQYLPSSCTGAY
ncbi:MULTISPECIES: pilin [Psychrobacter]|uniref:Type IV pilin PilA n=1 Tax=Psychrobacter nivimaris TaxID=281738 RepID=A0A6N7C3D5_9GAMM|nr:pilin [Psychrobacter nivimaris]KAF0569781.1 hypothetical protein FQV37_2406 [Psychrobacter nivimaris]|tara:strand:+ start:3697 stop:4203 length:507 start_codon:yes stop_codon:yes gene_type:complete